MLACMSAVILKPPEQHWVCPNCDLTAVTHMARPHTEFHNCRGLLAMSVPMVLDGTKAKVELVERGDYVGTDIVQLDPNGKPWMAAVTTRDDGQDNTVYAAHASGGRQ